MSTFLGCKSSAPSDSATAAQPLAAAPAAAATPAAAPAKRTTPDPSAIYLLFEGPWLFTNSGVANGQMTVTSVFNPMHDHIVGKWGRTGILNPISMNSSERWSGSLANPPATPNSFMKVVGDGFTNRPNPAVFLKGIKLVPDPTDISITLPVPDEVLLGGRFTNGSIKDASGTSLNQTIYTTTILKYKPAAGKPLNLNIGKQAATPIAAVASDHVVFRLRHHGCFDIPTEIKHIQDAFHDLQLRIGNGVPSLQLLLNGREFEGGSLPDGLADDELGIGDRGNPPTPCPAVAPRSGGWSNCAGGGMGGGCDPGTGC